MVMPDIYLKQGLAYRGNQHRLKKALNKLVTGTQCALIPVALVI